MKHSSAPLSCQLAGTSIAGTWVYWFFASFQRLLLINEIAELFPVLFVATFLPAPV